MQHITILGFKKVLGTSITIPMEMLHAADLILRIDGRNYRKLQMELASIDAGNVPLIGGLELVCKKKITDISTTDLIIIPALWGNPAGIVKQYPGLIAWLQQQNQKQTLICAVGTGSYFLAEAGLLDNKVATTHWYYFKQFAARYPDVHLQRDRFITLAGNIYCAGSVNSVRDVMLHFIEQFYNPDVANQVSRHFTHEVKRSYSSVFLKNSPQNIHDDEGIIEIQEWMHNRFSSTINLDDLAQQFGLSLRSLNRHFKKATDKSPMQYLQQIRLENAKELLKTSNLSIAEVAFNVGFPNSSYFSALFKKTISLSPRQYRLLVRKKLFTLNK
ncbi:MAG: helix-turn-helix domain-containing protein [Pseudomonadales bacterium]|nr:helix-turn-helix domain-containing protein [Pseudomonadales bacterium]